MEQSTIPARFSLENPCRKPGFTLVEILVVIVIIAVLASVAIFATRGVRQKAMQVNAISSLRQVSSANIAYSTENNGDINTMRWDNEQKTEGRGGKYVADSFWGRLQPYMFADVSITDQKKLKVELEGRLDQLFNSTDSRQMAGTFLQGSRIYKDGSGLPIPLGFNTNLHQFDKVLKTTKFGDPAQVLYAAYGYGFFTEAHGQTYVKRPTDNSIPNNKIYYFDNKTAAFTFLDGHVEILSPPIPDRRFK